MCVFVLCQCVYICVQVYTCFCEFLWVCMRVSICESDLSVRVCACALHLSICVHILNLCVWLRTCVCACVSLRMF